MMKLDPTSSSVIEIDSHALHTVTGGVPPATSAAKPKKTGKGKGIAAGICLLGCHILGPEHPGPDDIGPYGPVGGPQGRPPAGAPPASGGGPKPIQVPGKGVILIPE